ncbi:MAG: hypothetical protein HY905_19775 [Deltaproteobacteria bacterium]|nr:hypothetical protein [Deltaproteobacteria bacterium]
MSYSVKVVKGQFKLEGEFHTAEPNQAIRDEKGKLCGITNPRRVVHHHSYGGEAPFFQGIGDGRLWATRCDNKDCEVAYQAIFIPFRIHCPDCLGKNTPVDITDLANKTAHVYSFMVCERSGAFNSLEKPIRFINVEFDGVSTILMSYLLGKTNPEIGMKVRPIFRTKKPTFTITDLAFVPAETKEKDLPAGFTFSK